jgi:hypothetical protein
MPWKLKMDALRFLTMLVAAVAAWMVIMWFALAAVSAAPDAHGDLARSAPTAEVDDPGTAQKPAAARPAVGGRE